jgi:hypothetical protein
MSHEIYRNGKLEKVSDAEWERLNEARQAARAAAVKKIENKGGKVTVTTEDGRKHRIGGIGNITGNIGNLIVGGSGPINTGSGDVYIDGKKQPKKPKRNPWF